METPVIKSLSGGQRGNRPTLKTIAKQLGLGVTTVSRALKDGPELSPETRKRVQEAARAIGYRPDRAGVRLRTGKTNVIALALDAQEQIGHFVSEMIFGISEGLAETPYHLVVLPYSRLEDPMKPIRHLVETGLADGVIITRIEPDDSRVRYMLEHGMPFAAHGRTCMGVDHPFYDFDNEAFANIAVRKLAALGRRRLALLAPPAGLTFHDHMRTGFMKAMAEYGLEEIPFDVVNNDYTVEQIRDASRDLFSRPVRPDGIVSGSGGVSGTGGATFAVIAGMEAAGMRLREDVDVVAKQLFRKLPLLRKELHVVYEDIHETGRELARILLAAIDGTPGGELQRLQVPTEVVSIRAGIL